MAMYGNLVQTSPEKTFLHVLLGAILSLKALITLLHWFLYASQMFQSKSLEAVYQGRKRFLSILLLQD